MARETQHPSISSGPTPIDPAAALGSLADALPDPLLVVESDGRVSACNATAERCFQLDKARIVGGPVASLFDPDCRDEIRRLVTAGWAWVSERRFTLVDGRLVGLNARPWASPDGSRFLVSCHDLTTRWVLDEAADQQRRLETLADFAANIARELNDPMSIVQGRLELLLELGVDDPDAVRRHLDVALEHARRVSATLCNLRLVGRTTEPIHELVGIDAVVTEAMELVGPRARSVAVEIRPPDLATSGEAAMYVRVFASLLRRALDQASRTGQVEFRAVIEGGQVVARITTRGRLPRGWAEERAHRGPAEEDGRAAESTTIDETLLASAGARLWVDSGPGERVYRVFLPPAPHRRARAKPVEEHLLVVGAEELDRNIRTLLGREGFAFTWASGADQAAALCATTRFDAVVTELLLDGMSGLGLAELLLREHPALAARIVLVAPTRMETVPPSVIPVDLPLRRRPLLEALGRRLR